MVTSGKESLLKTVCSRMNIIIRPTTFNRKGQSGLMCSSLLSRQYYESSPKYDKAETLMWSFLWFIALYLGMLLYSTLLHLRLYLLLSIHYFFIFIVRNTSYPVDTLRLYNKAVDLSSGHKSLAYTLGKPLKHLGELITLKFSIGLDC